MSFAPFSPLGRRIRKLERRLRQQDAEVEADQTTQDAAIEAVEADIVSIEAIGPSAGIADRRFNDYLFEGAGTGKLVVGYPSADLASLPEGWYQANGSNGTADWSAITTPTGYVWVQQVGPFPT